MGKKHTRGISCLALLLTAALLLSGCAGTPERSPQEGSSSGGTAVSSAAAADGVKANGSYITQEELLTELEKKYGGQEGKVEYGEPISGLARNGTLDLKLGFDLKKPGMEKYSEVANLFWDAELTQAVDFRYDYDEAAGKLTLKPGPYSVGGIYVSSLTTEEVREYPHDTISLFSKGAYEDWGNVGKFYLVQYVDDQTGKKLEKPVVRIVTTQGELEAPRIVFQPTETGLAGFRWNAVKGAQAYVVFKISRDADGGYSGGVTPIAMTGETFWRSEAPTFSSYSQVNSDFRQFRYSEDDWAADRVYEKEGLTEGKAVADSSNNYSFGVIALGQDGTSVFSNLYEAEELAPNLPYAEAAAISKKNGFTNDCADIGLAPSHVRVTMCDGTTARKLINYEVDSARVETNRYLNIDEETGEYVSGEDLDVLQIPYTVEGAPFEYVLEVVDYDKSTIEQDMKTLRERQESLRQRSGSTEVTGEAGDLEGAAEQVREFSGETVTANSTLSEYLARCMLGRTGLIDLTGVPGSGDADLVADALLEAYYQNPLILGLQGYRINKDATKLKITYEEDAAEAAKKQQEIKAKVSEVTAEIITPGMTDLERELAINSYLCDTIEYDMAALENAEQYNYAKTDPEFNDSFTAYGALLKGKCICAGYAAAFKLLADSAGLESIVVTGMLEGTMSHAWNKVKLDGTWEVVDSTNNDNEELFNALLNIPGTASRLTLVEDKQYVLDSVIPNYALGSEDSREYYHISDKFFPVNAIAQELASELKAEGKATLRTEYDLTDGSFQQIAQEVYRLMEDDVSLSGYFWMGVIYLEQV